MPLQTVKDIIKHADAACNGFVKLLVVVGFFCASFFLVKSSSSILNHHLLGISDSLPTLDYTFVTVSPTVDMEVVLKKYNLWDIQNNEAVEPIVFNRYPRPVDKKKIQKRKKLFFYSMLPAALVAQAEVKQERQLILSAISKIGKGAYEINFEPQDKSWQKTLDNSSINNLIKIASKYEDNNAEDLLKKVNTIPVSLILAQSAIESAWGESRFALKGNNMFGIWTWGENGMVPKERDSGKNHRVAVFVSILDSVRTYTLMLNKLKAYKRFRDIRYNSSDSLELAEGLINYSSRRSLYVRDIKKMITLNKLQKLDAKRLALI